MGRPNFTEITPVNLIPTVAQMVELNRDRKRVTIMVYVIDREGVNRVCTVYGQPRSVASGAPPAPVIQVAVFGALGSGGAAVTRILDDTVGMQFEFIGVGYDGAALVDPNNIRVTFGEANDG